MKKFKKHIFNKNTIFSDICTTMYSEVFGLWINTSPLMYKTYFDGFVIILEKINFYKYAVRVYKEAESTKKDKMVYTFYIISLFLEKKIQKNRIKRIEYKNRNILKEWGL